MISIDPIRRMDDQALIIYSRKFTLPLPQAFIDANNLQARDEMVIFRERVNGHDALIIIPKKSVENNSFIQSSPKNGEAKALEGTI